MIVLNAVVVGNWAFIVCVALWPSKGFIADIGGMIAQTTGVKSLECAQVGFSLKVSN